MLVEVEAAVACKRGLLSWWRVLAVAVDEEEAVEGLERGSRNVAESGTWGLESEDCIEERGGE